MAQTVQDPTHERIEIVDQPEDISGEEKKRSWLLIPLVIVVIAALFFLARRFTGEREA